LTDAEHGVLFDMAGNGNLLQIGWTAKNSTNAFLALPGPDGYIHNGKQLFGNFTPQPQSNLVNPNGFAALAVYDDSSHGGNGDGVIDSRDSIFSSLRLWIDVNHDGIGEPEELYTLASRGVEAIGLSYREDKRVDQYGNRFRYVGRVNPHLEKSQVDRKVYDVFFVEGQSAEGVACPVDLNAANTISPRR